MAVEAQSFLIAGHQIVVKTVEMLSYDRGHFNGAGAFEGAIERRKHFYGEIGISFVYRVVMLVYFDVCVIIFKHLSHASRIKIPAIIY